MAIDMFLKIEGVEGESTDKSHKGEIDILSWSWGMDSPGDAFGLPTGRTNVELLRLTKRVDSASTALMSALLLGERPHWYHGMAFACIVVGNSDKKCIRIPLSGGSAPHTRFYFSFLSKPTKMAPFSGAGVYSV